MRQLITERGSASAIRTAAESWNTDVGGRASTQAGLLTKEALETDNEWTGDAADRYGEAVTSQGRALTQIKTITDTLQTTLNEIATALKVYWVAIAIAFGTYVALMIGCIIGAATVVATVPSLLAARGSRILPHLPRRGGHVLDQLRQHPGREEGEDRSADHHGRGLRQRDLAASGRGPDVRRQREGRGQE